MDRVQRPPMISVTAREESDAAALAVARCVAHAKEEQESSLPRQTSLLPGEVRTPSTMVTLADWAAPGSSIWFDETENNAPTATSANNTTNSGGVDGVRRSTHQSPLAAYNAVSDVWGDGSALLGGGEDDVGNERGTAMTHGHTVGGPHDRVALHGPAGTAVMPIVDDAVAAKAAATLNALGPHELPTPPLQPQPAPSLSVSAARGSAATSYVASTGVTHSVSGSNVHAGYEGAAMPAYPTAAHVFPAAPMPQSYAMPPSVQGFYRDGENQRQTSTTGSHYSSNNENNNNNYNSNSSAAPTSFFTVQEGRQQQQRQQMQQQEDEAAEQQAREQQMLRGDGLASGQAYLPHTSNSHGAGVSLTPGLYGTNSAAAGGGGANVPMSVSTLMRYGVQQQQQQSALMPSQYTPTQPYFVPTSSQTSSHSGAESRRGVHRANFTAPAVEGSGSETYAYPPHTTATAAAAAALQPLSAPTTAATMHSGTVSPLSGGGGYETQGGMMPIYGGMPNNNNNNVPYLPSTLPPPPPPPMAYEDDNGWQPGRDSMRRMTGPAPHESSGPGWHGPPMPMSSATTSNAYYNSGSVPGIYPVVPPMSAPDTRPMSHVDSDSVGYGAGLEGYTATANDSARRMTGSERMNELQARNGGMGGPQLGSYGNGATAMRMSAAGTTTTTAPAAGGGGSEEATGAVPRVKTAGERVHEALYFIANYFPPPPPPKVPAEDRRSRAELWYHYATIWDLTHRLPPPPRTPLPEMELEQRMRLQELTRTPYRGDGWLRRSDHWFNVVQCLFDYPEDNRGSRVDPQFVLQHAVTS